MALRINLAWDLHWGAAAGESNADAEAGFPLVTGIDMDLDVIRRLDTGGAHPIGTFIDDRDEWDENRVAFGYPEDVVELLDEVTTELAEAVEEQYAPFDDATADAWLDRLAALPPRPFPTRR